MPDGVTRTQSRQVPCPYCGAAAGERCVGVRGKPREANHLERTTVAQSHANVSRPSVTLQLGEANELLWGDVIVGRLTGVEISLDLTPFGRGDGEPTEGEASGSVDVDIPLTSEVISLQGGVGTNEQSSLLPDPINETWELYVTLLERPKMQLTPKYRKWIADAHQAVGVEMTQEAIRGLAASEYHRQNHYIGLEYAIVPKRGQSIEGRVELMAAKASAGPVNVKGAVMGVSQLLERFPAEHRHRVEPDIIAPINAMLANPDDNALAIEGERALRRLQGYGFDAVIENGEITGARVR